MVGMLDRDGPRLEQVHGQLADRHGAERVVALLADVGVEDQVQTATNRFAEVAPGLNLVVNNAGVLIDGAFCSLSFQGLNRFPWDKWNETLRTNLGGAFLVTRAAVELMLRAKEQAKDAGYESRGLIVTVSSVSRVGRSGQAAYSASKGGLISLAMTLAQELAPCRLRSVAIAPGLVDTPMAGRIPESYRRDMIERTALKRMGRPDEVAHAVRFCIENEFFNGRVLELDGGPF